MQANPSVSMSYDTGLERKDNASGSTVWPVYVNAAETHPSKDHFVEVDGARYAGTHLIIDFWDAEHLDDLKLMEQSLRDAVSASGATLLHIHLHHFTPNGGISGVAVLAESHISVHTWPERRFAAFDVFMCGEAMPEKAVEVLRRTFSPGKIIINKQLRGAEEP